MIFCDTQRSIPQILQIVIFMLKEFSLYNKNKQAFVSVTQNNQRINSKREYNGNNPCIILDYANENELWIVMSETVLLCTNLIS